MPSASALTAPVENIDPVDWDRTIAVDLNGQFYCTRLAVPLLKAAGGGSIVNIASNAAFFGFPMRLPYASCKWALIGFTKTLAMELGPHAIRVNAICPGSVAGPRIERVIERDAAARGCSVDSGVDPGNKVPAHVRGSPGRNSPNPGTS
ncbi:MAG: SDR family NAD(P)-dependent oxidoreductase [Woeseiaceae bacterium]|nr:SDR family NAD(P)-dependent oxidoreductase [Woeseiaceae bacterium]